MTQKMTMINIKTTCTCIELSANEKYLAIASQNGLLQVVDLEQEKIVLEVPSNENTPHLSIENISFSADEKFIAFSYHRKVQIYDIQKAQILRSFNIAHEEGLYSNCVRFCPYRAVLYFSNGTQIIRYDVLKNEIKGFSMPFFNGFAKIAISNCGKYLAYKSENHNPLVINFLTRIYVFSTENFTIENSFELNYDYLSGGQMYRAVFDFSPKNPNHLLILHKTQGIIKWDWKEQKIVSQNYWNSFDREHIFSPEIESFKFQYKSELVAFRSYNHHNFRQDENKQVSCFDFGKANFVGNLPIQNLFEIGQENFYFLTESNENENFTIKKILFHKNLDL